MKFPHIIKPNLTAQELALWHNHYQISPSGFNRHTEEGLWRRTQELRTKDQSNWQDPNDARRRMLHYKHTFDVIPQSADSHALALIDTYLWLHLNFPSQEIMPYHKKLIQILQLHHWTPLIKSETQASFQKNDLQITLTFLPFRQEDLQHNRSFPSHYQILEVLLTTRHHQPDSELTRHPWIVLKSGIRTKDTRQRPQLITDETIQHLVQYLPAQIELGCGSSIEANIPPLGFLHEVYHVSNRQTHQFILDLQKDTLIQDLITNTPDTFEKFTRMYQRCFEAPITTFYQILAELHQKGFLVGDIITNNFDGLPTRLGLTEYNVRRYDEVHIIPQIDFHPQAKSLIVIGNHADRRKVEASARKQGLKVIYIDPEGFYTDEGFIPYPLESPQNEDLLYQTTATHAFTQLNAYLQSLV